MLFEENNNEIVVVNIDPTGDVQGIYSDELYDLFSELGNLRRPRASDINEDSETGLFVADLQRIGGPVLSGFKLKSDAEKAEVEWITKHVLKYSQL